MLPSVLVPALLCDSDPGPGAQDIRVNSEWTRWQEADKWAWDGGKRQRWAEGLWRHQHKRSLQRDALRRSLAAAEARQRAEVGALWECTGIHPLSWLHMPAT